MVMGFPLSLLYLDPTTGGVLLQAILGGTAGGLVLVRLFWRKIVSLVRRDTRRDSGDVNPKEPEDEGQQTR